MNRITATGNPSVYLERVDTTYVAASANAPEHWVVSPIWAGVDRPDVGGTACPTAGLAVRLSKAILAGAALGPATVRTDVNGKTYVEASHRFLARILNADLKRLGF